MPGVRSGKVKSPFPLVAPTCGMPVALSSICTVALGTSAPVLSVTLPSRVADTCLAPGHWDKQKNHRREYRAGQP